MRRPNSFSSFWEPSPCSVTFLRHSAFVISAVLLTHAASAQQVRYSAQHRDSEQALPQVLSGPPALKQQLADSRRSIALAVGDLDGDGSQDLITGYATGSGGALTLQSGFAAAIAPGAPQISAMQQGHLVAPFQQKATVVAIPVRPDFLRLVDLNGDGSLDVLVAMRGDSSLYVLPGDGAGHLGAPRPIVTAGAITAISSWSDATGTPSLVVGLCYPDKECALQILEQGGDVRASIHLPGPASAIEVAALNRGQTQDLVVVAGGRVLLVNGDSLATSRSAFESLSIAGVAASVASGSFVYDKRGLRQLAILGTDATLHILARTGIDSLGITNADVLANRQIRLSQPRSLARLSGIGWTEAETLIGIGPATGDGPPPLMLRARLSGGGGDDLAVMAAGQFVQVSHPVSISAADPALRETHPIITLDATGGNVVAAVAARLSPDARSGLLIADLRPQPRIAVPPTNRIFNVTTTVDGLDSLTGGRCVTLNPCTLRDAIALANADSAADGVTKVDVINLPAGTYPFTTAFHPVNDSQGSIGYHFDLDTSVNIVGAGAATTILDGGTLDKIFSVNSGVVHSYAPFDVFISGVTMQNGTNNNNPSTATSSNYFGGLVDWESNGSGYLTFNNVTMKNGIAKWGPGGAIADSDTPGGVGVLEIDNSTLTNNVTPETGGAIFAGFNTPLSLTADTITSNQAKISVNPGDTAAIGQGGGIFAYGNTTGLRSSVTGSSFVGNTASDAGGGIYSLTGILSSGVTLVGNTAGTYGGGLYFNTANETGTFAASTLTGNAAPIDGGGIFVGTSTTSNVLQLRYSRIHGNTSTSGHSGIAVGVAGNSGGSVTATQNWWGCNGPATGAGCDTGAANAGTLLLTPYTRLSLTLSATTANAGQTLTATGDMGHDSSGTALGSANLAAFTGVAGIARIVQADSSSTTNTSPLDVNASIADSIVISAAGTGTASTTFDGFTVSAPFTGTAPALTLLADHSPTYFHPGDTANSITLNISNSGNGSTSANIVVTEALPPGITATAIGGAGWTCTLATVSCTLTNPNQIVAPAASLPTITVTVSVATGSSSAGTYTNTATASGGGASANGTSTNNILVVASPMLATSFSPSVVAVGANSAYSFTLSSIPNNPVTISGITFADTLPTGMVVSTPSSVTGSCGGGTITAAAGSSSISLSGATLAAAASCTFAINVHGNSVATYPATTGFVTSTQGGQGNAASSTLFVDSPPSIVGSFGSSNLAFNGSTSLSFTISNPNAGGSITGVAFTDTLPAGLVVATPNGLTGSCGGGAITATAGGGSISLSTATIAANGSCTFSLNVAATTAGTKSNSETVTSTEGGTGNTSTQSLTVALPASKLVFNTPPAPSVAAGTNGSTIVVYEEDSSNALTTGAHDNITLTVSGPNAYAASYNAQASGGMATFNLSAVTLTTAGSYTYTATSGGLSQAQAGQTVSAAAIAGFAVTGFNNPAQAAAASSFTVKAVDPFNNTVPNFLGTIAFTSSDPLAILPASYTFTPSDGGVHIFNATLNTAGAQSVTVTSGATNGAQIGISVLDSTWIINTDGSLVRFGSDGVQTTTGGIFGTASNSLQGIAIDASGNAWATSSAGVEEVSRSGITLSGSGYTGGGVNAPTSLAIDGLGMVWVLNQNNTISVLTNAGVAVTPSSGFVLPGSAGTPTSLLIDGSGAVWLANSSNATVTKVIGAAAPIITPTVTATTTNSLATRP
jgi:hypothetical protein